MKTISLSLFLAPAAVATLVAGIPMAWADGGWQTEFRRADLNDSGGLSIVELDKAKSPLLKPIRTEFKQIDAERDGQVSEDEYQHFLSKRDDDFERRFRQADLNDSDGLSQKELGKVSGGDFDTMRNHFSAIDHDRDGQVTLQEYRAYQTAEAKPVATTKTARTAQTSVARDHCRPDCGVVVDVDRYKIEGEGSPLGAIAGGVAGGLLGNQIGGGKGKTVATVGGLAGGAYAGYQVEKRLKTKKMVKVSVKFDNGTHKDFEFEADVSPFARGARVQLKEGQLVQYTGD